MKKSKRMYYIMLIAFMVIIIIFNVTFFIRYSTIKGNANIYGKYYEIVLLTDNDDVIINEHKASIKLKGNKASTSFIMYNIGNLNATIDNYVIDNIKTNLDENNIKINVSLEKNSIINGKENVINNVTVECNKCSFKETDYIDFDINYLFK